MSLDSSSVLLMCMSQVSWPTHSYRVLRAAEVQSYLRSSEGMEVPAVLQVYVGTYA